MPHSQQKRSPFIISRRSFLAASMATLASSLSPQKKASASVTNSEIMRAYANLLTSLMEEDYGVGWLEFQIIELAEGSAPALVVTTVLPDGPRNVRLFFYSEASGAELVAAEGGSRGWVYYLPNTGFICCSGNHSSASWDYLFQISGQGVSRIASMNGGYGEPDFFESAPKAARYMVYDTETDADGYIAAIQNSLGFEPSLFFGMHLEMVDPIHSWVPMGSRDLSCPSYPVNKESISSILGVNPDDPSLLWQPADNPDFPSIYASYLAKLQEYVDSYGMPSIIEVAYPAGRVTGCSYAQVIPLGGKCQLGQLVVVYDNGTDVPGERYNVEVWDYDNGETTLVWQSHEFPGHEGYTYYIAFDQKGDSTYLSKITVAEMVLGAEQYAFLEDGTFGPIPCDATAQYDGAGGYTFAIAGGIVSPKEFQAYFFDARNVVDLSNNGGSDESSNHHRRLVHTANSVNNTLDLLKLGSEGWEVHFPSTLACAIEKTLELPYLDAQPLTFPITEDPSDPLHGTTIRSASWCENELGRCLSFLTYGGTELLAYPSIDRCGYLSFTFRTSTGIEVHRSLDPIQLDAETPSYWYGDDGAWY